MQGMEEREASIPDLGGSALFSNKVLQAHLTMVCDTQRDGILWVRPAE